MASSTNLPKGAKQLLYEANENSVYLCDYDIGPELGLVPTQKNNAENNDDDDDPIGSMHPVSEDPSVPEKETQHVLPSKNKDGIQGHQKTQVETRANFPATWIALNLTNEPLKPKVLKIMRKLCSTMALRGTVYQNIADILTAINKDPTQKFSFDENGFCYYEKKQLAKGATIWAMLKSCLNISKTRFPPVEGEEFFVKAVLGNRLALL